MIRAIPLKNKSQTVENIRRIIETHWRDLKSFTVKKNGKRIRLIDLSLFDIFDLVKNFPYVKDENSIEVIARPQRLLTEGNNIGMDCKKKTILIGSWLHGNDYNYRLIGSSNKKNGNIHHIFPQVRTSEGWKNLDATYPKNKIFETRRVTNYEIW